VNTRFDAACAIEDSPVPLQLPRRLLGSMTLLRRIQIDSPANSAWRWWLGSTAAGATAITSCTVSVPDWHALVRHGALRGV